MTNIEKTDNKEISGITNEFKDLKEEINEIYRIKSYAEKLGIPSAVVFEYVDLLKDFYYPNRIKKATCINDNIKNLLWFDKISYDIDYYKWIVLFYIKNFASNNFENITNLILSN